MEKQKVYFTDMRSRDDRSLLEKLDSLLTRAGIEQIDFKKKFTAIKMHFGEPGNLSFLRPNFAKVVADRVTALGGRPFLTDCNTLYVGRRGNAIDHLGAAAENGFSPLSCGCPVIIGDGLKGGDDVEVPVEGGVYCKTARIGQVVMDADVLLSLTHFKGHEMTGFGGAIKNIGMGCGSRAGKMQMHNDGKPVVDEKCQACGRCFKYCAQDAIQYDVQKKAHINHEKCVGCGRCIAVCSFHAIANPSGTALQMVDKKMVEYAKAVLAGRPHFHISVVNQVSPYCDCHSYNDAAVVPDIGMFASFYPVALDHACIDAVNAATPLPNSALSDAASNTGDYFRDIHHDTDWRAQIHHAEQIGLGSGEYELVTIK